MRELSVHNPQPRKSKLDEHRVPPHIIIIIIIIIVISSCEKDKAIDRVMHDRQLNFDPTAGVDEDVNSRNRLKGVERHHDGP